MPLLEYKATSYLHVFVLNALASALIIVIAIYIKGRFDTFRDSDGNKVKQRANFRGMFMTFLFTFVASIAGYAFLHYTIGYGEGMIIGT